MVPTKLYFLGFYNFARQVSFSLNTTQFPHIDAKFFADCDHKGYYNETATCYNVETKSISFIAQLTLKEEPSHFGNVSSITVPIYLFDGQLKFCNSKTVIVNN